MRIQSNSLDASIPRYLDRGAQPFAENKDTFERAATVPADPSAMLAQQALLARTVAVTASPLRDPQQGADFVRNFNTQLNLAPDVLTAKEQLTISSPAKFLRVNPALFYQDLKGPHAAKGELLNRPAPQIYIQGDCHLGNFGTVRAADGRTIWGLNDYDMAAKGSASLDLERLATSLILMAPPEVDAKALIAQAAHSYLVEMARLADSGPATDSGLHSAQAQGPIQALIDQQSAKSQHHVLKKFCNSDATALQRNDELLQTLPEEEKFVHDFLGSYDKTQGATPGVQRPLEVLDVAHRVESGGSTYGLPRFYALVKGTGADPVIMEIKQELPSAPETASGQLNLADGPHIFQGMSALGGAPNPLMAAANTAAGAYFVREREREKGGLDLTKLSPSDWTSVVSQAGQALALAHAHQPGAAKAVTAWVGSDEATFTGRLQDFAASYAEQTRQDTQVYASSLGLTPATTTVLADL